jgi:enoyl-CoA hydratase/carnithine racemase
MSVSNESAATPYEELVLIEDRGDYAILTINRPEKRNAMSVDAMTRLREGFAEVRSKKVVVLTGTGSSFCSGVDLSSEEQRRMNELTRQDGSRSMHPWSLVQADIRAHPAIFVAAVNGHALGGGSTLINVCDLAIAAESATVGLPEMSFGGWPLAAGPAAIKRLAPKHAAELIFTARRIDAATAYRMALVNKVVPDDQLLTEATALAAHIAGFNAVALDWGKKAFARMQEMSIDEAQDYSTATQLAIQARSTAVIGIPETFSGQPRTEQGA